MASESAVKRRPAPTADELADTILDRILANDHTHHANPDAPCVSCEDEDVDHAFISTQITWAIAAAREAERERCARYVDTHFPVVVSGPGRDLHWEMREEVDGGKVQSEYAAALRRLKEPAE